MDEISQRLYVERTLAIIKPDVVHKSEEIEKIILKAGFLILQRAMVTNIFKLVQRTGIGVVKETQGRFLVHNIVFPQWDRFEKPPKAGAWEARPVKMTKRRLLLSPEQCSEFYAHQYGKLFFPSLTAFMSSGPIVVMTLARHNGITHWRSMIGPDSFSVAKESHPESLRAKYGTSDLKNALHGSDTFLTAVREIRFMFPNTVIEPFHSKEQTEEYLSTNVIPVLLHGLTELCKEKPLHPCIWLADWLLNNDPSLPQINDGDILEDKK